VIPNENVVDVAILNLLIRLLMKSEMIAKHYFMMESIFASVAAQDLSNDSL
jgi:hypothetical protein